MEGNSTHIKNLSRCDIAAIGKAEKPKGSVVKVLKHAQIFMPLEGLVDVEKEKSRINTQMDKFDAEMSSIKARLKNDEFLRKAPKEVVEASRERLKELRDRRSMLEDNLSGLE